MAHFREKLSRALLDRFDLVVAMPRPRAAELDGSGEEASALVRERVQAARERLEEKPPRLGAEARALLTDAVERMSLSGRGRARVARVARTIAALAGADEIAREHLAEALSYRIPVELTER
jgi:magnesium chelatase family protein